MLKTSLVLHVLYGDLLESICLSDFEEISWLENWVMFIVRAKFSYSFIILFNYFYEYKMQKGKLIGLLILIE